MPSLALGWESWAQPIACEILALTIDVGEGAAKPFADCTSDELERAIDRIGGGEGGEMPALPRGSGKRIDAIVESIERGTRGDELPSQVTHRVRRVAGKQRVIVSIEFPLESAARVGAALSRAGR